MAEWRVDITRGRHSFPFVYRIRPLWGDEAEWLVWYSKATVAQRKPVWTGINYQSVYRRGGRLPKLFELCWQITSEILSMNANWDAPLALTLATAEIQISVHAMVRWLLFTSAQPSPVISAIISAALLPLSGSRTSNCILTGSKVAFTSSTSHVFPINLSVNSHIFR